MVHDRVCDVANGHWMREALATQGMDPADMCRVSHHNNEYYVDCVKTCVGPGSFSASCPPADHQGSLFCATRTSFMKRRRHSPHLLVACHAATVCL